jgi:TPP-dependent pyruvate/acetoin dehydrogenase alpha subunit
MTLTVEAGMIYNQPAIQRPRRKQEISVTMTGKVRAPLAEDTSATGGSLISNEKLKQLYVTMLQCRLLTERAHLLGKKASLRASMGQEAIATACAIDLSPDDTLVLPANDSVAGLVKGIPLGDLVAQLYAPKTPASAQGDHLSAATAAAVAHKRKKNNSVVVVFTGEATTALPCWDDALKFARKRRLPIMFVVENNPWPGGKLKDEQEDFAQKARSYGLFGITVDGNDVVAVYRVAYESLDRLRQGDGPVLVEARPYHLAGQRKLSKSDRDPLVHMERYLTAKKLFTERWKQTVIAGFSRQLDAAVKAAK